MIWCVLPFSKSRSSLIQKASISKWLGASPYAQWDAHLEDKCLEDLCEKIKFLEKNPLISAFNAEDTTS